MLNVADLETYRNRLRSEIASLDAEDADSADERGIVMLDQQSVGRLSRMDAMQRQAMAEATKRRRSARRQRILAALKRIENGEFGYCHDCGDDLDPARLDLDPTVPRCVSCTSG